MVFRISINFTPLGSNSESNSNSDSNSDSNQNIEKLQESDGIVHWKKIIEQNKIEELYQIYKKDVKTFKEHPFILDKDKDIYIDFVNMNLINNDDVIKVKRQNTIFTKI